VNRPYFKGKPIASLKALANALRVQQRQLSWVIDHADKLYRELPPEPKPDGGVRQLYNPAKTLKDIQRRINRYIFSRVYFPEYLQGGIKDKNNPRHCKSNAKLHTGAKILINEDISGFFPSITKDQVHNIWQHFFCFPSDIAVILTSLTTHNSQVPQGAPTSTYLANLALWKDESATVDILSKNGFRYSRYIDDMSLSSISYQNGQNKTEAVRSIRRMCDKNGYSVKRSKHRIESSCEPMRINNLQINNGVTLPKSVRANIRAAVHSCEKYSETDRTTDEYLALYNSTLGKVNYLRQFHDHAGNQLAKRLENHPPL
jgi:hypothetical protein